MGASRFSAMVKLGMRDAGVTLRELCRKASLDPSFLSKVLAGKRSPPAEEEALRRLARALGVDPAELVVAAGRVPAEWRRLTEDREAFRLVHRLLTGQAVPAAPSKAAERAKTAEESAERRPRRRAELEAFAEELL